MIDSNFLGFPHHSHQTRAGDFRFPGLQFDWYPAFVSMTLGRFECNTATCPNLWRRHQSSWLLNDDWILGNFQFWHLGDFRLGVTRGPITPSSCGWLFHCSFASPTHHLVCAVEACSGVWIQGLLGSHRYGYGTYRGSVVLGTELHRTTAGQGHATESCWVLR